MNRRGFSIAMLVFGSARPGVHAQTGPGLPRIGFVSNLSAVSMAQRVEAFRRGLLEHGYTEGRNILVEYRFANGKTSEIPAVIAELAGLKVAAIVTTGPSSTRPVHATTKSIPIVMGFDPDPVGSGFVASLARPGGNVTGFSTTAPEISAKQLEILRDFVPGLANVLIVANSNTAGANQTLSAMESAGRTLKLRLTVVEVQSATAIDSVFDEASKSKVGAVIVVPNPVVAANRHAVIRAARRNRLPTIYLSDEFVEEGGLMTYSASLPDLFRRSAYLVDRILKGSKPADLPVEQPTTFDFVINLKAADEIGLKVPKSALVRATRLIE